MSAFSGPQGKGAMRRHREVKRAEAELRAANPAPEADRLRREFRAGLRLAAIHLRWSR